MRVVLGTVALLAMAACAPAVPESGPDAGVGFGDYDTYLRQQAQRDAALRGDALPPPQTVSSETLAPVSGTTTASTSALDPAAQVAADTAAALGTGQTVVDASPSNPPPEAVAASGISNENDFDDVSSLRTIESDAERLAANRAQYQVVQPTALPSRSGREGPNIVSYALQTSNPVGAQLYKRFSLSQARTVRNCAKYPSPDMAQSDFLAKGGPAKDRLGLDPDGDGFACAWDPSPFRAINGG